MKQTSNYQLNQWEQSDRILMKDFNRDNLIIENGFQALKAALAAEGQALSAETAAREELERQCRLQSLLSHNAAAAANILQIPLTGVNWGLWKCVHLVARPKLPEGGVCEAMFNFSARYPLGENLSGPLHVVLWSLNDGGLCVQGLRFGGTGGVVYFPDLTFGGITSLTLTTNNSGKQLQPGTTVVLYGEKG